MSLPESRRILAVADTDSYLKWSAATLEALPGGWERMQVVLDNPVAPSDAQIRAAVGSGSGADAEVGRAGSVRSVERVGLRPLRRLVRTYRPHVVLLAATGPVVAALSAEPVLTGRDRPVLVTGLPGVSIPATKAAVRFRTGCDLFLLHSHREVSAFAALRVRGVDGSGGLRFGLAHLPFLGGRDSEAAELPADAGGDLVFAAQAKVPPLREQRERILLALAASTAPVVKVRALANEQQTHHEALPYPSLLDDLIAAGRISAGAVRVAGGSMAGALATARGLVTVSSTAALEAMAAGLPVLVLADFGVGADMINLVFEGSGCLGTLDDLPAGRLHRPAPGWLRENYFHPASDDDWVDQLDSLLAARAAGTLPGRSRVSGSPAARLRRRFRLVLPRWVWAPLGRAWRRARGRTAPVPLLDRPH